MVHPGLPWIIRITVFINGDNRNGVEKRVPDMVQKWIISGPHLGFRPRSDPSATDRHPEMVHFWTTISEVLLLRHDVYTCVQHNTHGVYTWGVHPYVYRRSVTCCIHVMHLVTSRNKMKSPDYGDIKT